MGKFFGDDNFDRPKAEKNSNLNTMEPDTGFTAEDDVILQKADDILDLQLGLKELKDFKFCSPQKVEKVRDAFTVGPKNAKVLFPALYTYKYPPNCSSLLTRSSPVRAKGN